MEISLPVKDESVNAFLALPPSGKGPGLLLLHAWWGLKPFFKELCVRFAGEGFAALAPDLYNGGTATTIPEAEAMMEKSSSSFMRETILSGMDFLLAHPACASRTLGVIGFSMGAAWSLAATALRPSQVSAVVLYYGMGNADLGQSSAPVLGHFSDTDEWEPYDFVRQQEQNMRNTGRDVTFHVYPGQKHWFVEEDRPEYDPQSARSAWDRTVAFLKGKVQPIS